MSGGVGSGLATMGREGKDECTVQKPALARECSSGTEWGPGALDGFTCIREQDLVRGQDPSEISAIPAIAQSA